jgi:hypothetical protein
LPPPEPVPQQPEPLSTLRLCTIILSIMLTPFADVVRRIPTGAHVATSQKTLPPPAPNCSLLVFDRFNTPVELEKQIQLDFVC